VAGVPKASSITERASTPISRTPSLKSFPTEYVRTPGSPPYSRFTSKTRHGAPARISPRRMTFARCDFPEPFAPTITFTFSSALPPGENSSSFQGAAKENLWARGFGDWWACRENLRIPAGKNSVPGAADLGPGDPSLFPQLWPTPLGGGVFVGLPAEEGLRRALGVLGRRPRPRRPGRRGG
jgi:hypothetical protein